MTLECRWITCKYNTAKSPLEYGFCKYTEGVVLDTVELEEPIEVDGEEEVQLLRCIRYKYDGSKFYD